jgi:manganese transport protein
VTAPPPGPAAGEAVVPRGITPREQPEHRPSRLGRTVAMLGPAFVAAVAYVDPGNFATNIAGGAKYGYLLLWVVLAANLMAMVIQYLSAKLGVVSHHNLAEACRERFPRAVSVGLWIQAEIICMSTDIAELIGAAVALNLLFGVPLVPAGFMAALVAFAVLALQTRGYRKFELAISALLLIVLLGFVYEVFHVGPSARGSLEGLVPGFAGTESILLAVGIIGATVMPHAIYLHSALTQGRGARAGEPDTARVLRTTRLDIGIALGFAGIINLSMLAVAAKLFHHDGTTDVETIQQAHAGFQHLVGGGAALAFAVALLASGISSSSVGTFAGQVVMQGFIHRNIGVLIRRALTMIPALIVLAAGVSATDALVVSQVVLSFGIPFALIPLVLVTSDRRVMGEHANGPALKVVAWTLAALISALNVYLLAQQFVL